MQRERQPVRFLPPPPPIEDIYGIDVSESFIRAEGLIARRSSRGC